MFSTTAMEMREVAERQLVRFSENFPIILAVPGDWGNVVALEINLEQALSIAEQTCYLDDWTYPAVEVDYDEETIFMRVRDINSNPPPRQMLDAITPALSSKG